MGTNGVGKSYEEFLQSIKARGLNTTSLGHGEANFADYANALSSDLKEELLQSIGDEAGDAQLQSKVADLFGGKSVMQSAEIISAAKAAGLSCSVEYKSTSYIIDNKQDGHYDKDITNGAIAIYTFSDGNSTIKIADANGNGALEAEEIYLNEILSGVTNSIGATTSQNQALDNIKAQQEMLLKQIEENRKAQQEMLEEQIEESRKAQQEMLEEQIEESRKAQEEMLEKTDKNNDKKVTEDSDDETLSREKFEELVLQEALSNYNGDDSSNIKDIEKAVEMVKSEHNADLDFSVLDVIELSKELEKEKERMRNEKAEE